MLKHARGFTMLEMTIVIIIVGALATLAIGQYSVAREKAFDKEAISNLKLISTAEKGYRIDTGNYYVSNIIKDINNNLKLSLSADSNRIWNYDARANGCCATRTGTSVRTWSLLYDSADQDPILGACP